MVAHAPTKRKVSEKVSNDISGQSRQGVLCSGVKSVHPFIRNICLSPNCTGKAAGDRADGVGVAAPIHSVAYCLMEVICAAYGLERDGKRIFDITRRLNDRHLQLGEQGIGKGVRSVLQPGVSFGRFRPDERMDHVCILRAAIPHIVMEVRHV